MQEQEDETQLWHEMAALGPHDPLPVQMPDLLYTRLSSLMRFCDYPERLAPFQEHFPAEKCASTLPFLLQRAPCTVWKMLEMVCTKEQHIQQSMKHWVAVQAISCRSC